MSGGTITKILIRDTGTGYTSIPTVDLSAGSGSSGTATASFLPSLGNYWPFVFMMGQQMQLALYSILLPLPVQRLDGMLGQQVTPIQILQI